MSLIYHYANAVFQDRLQMITSSAREIKEGGLLPSRYVLAVTGEIGQDKANDLSHIATVRQRLNGKPDTICASARRAPCDNARRYREMQHRLVHTADLRARRVSTRCPSVGFALDKNRRFFAAEIESVSLLDLIAHGHGKVLLKPHASLSPEEPRGLFEVATGVGVTDRTDALESVDVHQRSSIVSVHPG